MLLYFFILINFRSSQTILFDKYIFDKNITYNNILAENGLSKVYKTTTCYSICQFSSSFLLINEVLITNSRNQIFYSETVAEANGGKFSSKSLPVLKWGVEFLGSVVLSVPWSFLSVVFFSAPIEQPAEFYGEVKWLFPTIYIVGNTLLSSGGTWLTGKLIEGNGSFGKAMVGALIGSAIGITSYFIVHGTSEGVTGNIGISTFLIAPSLGAVIGYNF